MPAAFATIGRLGDQQAVFEQSVPDTVDFLCTEIMGQIDAMALREGLRLRAWGDGRERDRHDVASRRHHG